MGALDAGVATSRVLAESAKNRKMDIWLLRGLRRRPCFESSELFALPRLF